eukprot:scaffold43275_cov67-Cyclotella_meneghiniana.AAC.5
MSFSSFVKFTGPEARGPGKGVPQEAGGHLISCYAWRPFVMVHEGVRGEDLAHGMIKLPNNTARRRYMAISDGRSWKTP